MINQPKSGLTTREQVDATLLQLKSWTADETPMSEEKVELLFENSIQLLNYCINKDRLPEDEVIFAELLACLRSAFGRAGEKENDARLLLTGVQKDDFLSKLVASFQILLRENSNVSPSSARILLRLAQVFTNILTLHYSTASNMDYIENSCLPLFDVDTLS